MAHDNRDYYKPLARDLIEGCLDYIELLDAVESKFEGETRHQTALRYIREAESNHTVKGEAE